MDCIKTGSLIAALRKEKGLTQKNIADALGIQSKTVSKWECGLGRPDLSLIADLSVILGVDTQAILDGEIRHNKPDNGNINRTKLYMCPQCGNVLFSTSPAGIFCCGRKLEPLKAEKDDGTLDIKAVEADTDYFITFNHPMEKDNYMVFAACVKGDRLMLNRFYPQQNREFRLPMGFMGRLYMYSASMGLIDCGNVKDLVKK